jgi:hypothetical protein
MSRNLDNPLFTKKLGNAVCVSIASIAISCTTGDLLAQALDNTLRPAPTPIGGDALLPAEEQSLEPVNDRLQKPVSSDDGKPSDVKESRDKDSSLKSSTPKSDGLKTESSKQESLKSKKREPIVLPALTIPNISVKGVGTGATPEDSVAGRLPPTIDLPFGPDRYGPWAIETKTWTAPVFCHQPTYFEEEMLEAHGHERFPLVQPLVSGARFYTTIATLPYYSYLNPPLKYTERAGYYRPGSAAPCIRQRAPYDKGALRFQLLTTGTVILIGQP